MMNHVNKGFPGGMVVKNPPANEGQARNMGSIPGWGISLGVGNGKPLQDSCLENSMDRGALQAAVYAQPATPMYEFVTLPEARRS